MVAKAKAESGSFDLAALIREMTEKYGPDPHDIAAKAAPRIPESERLTVLVKLLAHYIRSQKVRPPQAAAALRELGVAEAEETLSPTVHSVRQVRSGRLNRSAKVALLQRHAKLLRTQIRGADGFKWLGKCGYDDLMAAVAERRKIANSTTIAADNFEWLAAQLHEHNVNVVEQLPADVLEEYAAMLRAAA